MAEPNTTEEQEPKEQAMSTEDMLKEILGMVKSMAEQRKAESMTEEAEEHKKADSSVKSAGYSFAWPDAKPKESAILCDLLK